MTTWNTIARSKRVEWQRKEGRRHWEREMRLASLARWRWAYVTNMAEFEGLLHSLVLPYGYELDCRPGQIMRGAVAGSEASGPTHLIAPERARMLGWWSPGSFLLRGPNEGRL